MTFPHFPAIAAAIALMSLTGSALAQFTSPPSTPPPTCGFPKNGSGDFPDAIGSDCRVKLALPSITRIFLECAHHQHSVVCSASTDLYEDGAWVTLDPDTLTHGWSVIIDGLEYHFPPSFSHSISVDCGYTRRVNVHLSAGGSTALSEVVCPVPLPNEW